MQEPNVFIGKNQMTLNSATVMRILTDWLHINVSGGPFEVTGWDTDEDDAIGFCFQPVELEKSKC